MSPLRILAALCGLALATAGASAAQAQTLGTYSSHYVWNANRQLVMEIGPDPDGAGALKRMAIRYTYDADGQVTKVERGRTTTATGSDFVALQTSVETTYNAAGAKVKDVTPAGVTQYGYDGMGRATCTAIRMNPAVYASLPADACVLGTQGSDGPDRITRVDYDLAGQKTAITRALGTGDEYVYAAYSYTPNGQAATVRDGRSNPSAMEYDGFDRLVKLRFPPPAPIAATNASTTDYETYVYDTGGNRVSVRRRDGQVVDSCFDALNREYRRYMRDVTGCTVTSQANDVFTAYDLRNLALSTRFQATNGSGVIAAYDKAGRMTSEISYGRSVSFLYDAASHRTWVTYPTAPSFFVVSVYDAAGRVTALKENNVGTGQQLLATFTYDDLGQRTALTRGNGTSTTYGYDGASRLSSLVQNPATATWDQTYGFAFNPAGQLKSRADTNALYRWTPPLAGQAAAYDGLNRDAAIAAAPGGYDLRGNLTDDGPRTFTYDVENQLTSVTGGGPGLTLAYDPMGRLKSSTSAGVTTEYLYEGSRLIAEYSGTTVLRRYVHGPGTDEPLVWLEGAGVTDRRWLHEDRQGSVVAVSNGAGSVTQLYAYGPWGEPEGGNFSGSRFRYTGQIVLPEAGLYHYKARVYDPISGRFMQTDPIGYKDDLDLYAYVGGDPVNRGDPTGLCGTFCPVVAPMCTPGPQLVGCAIGVVGGGAVTACTLSAGCQKAVADTGRAIGDFIGNILTNEEAEAPEDKRRGSRPTDAPRGTRPIDDADIDKDDLHGIKDGIGARPDDYVGITPSGGIVTTDPQTGKAVDQGNISDHGVTQDRGRRDRERRDRERRRDDW